MKPDPNISTTKFPSLPMLALADPISGIGLRTVNVAVAEREESAHVIVIEFGLGGIAGAANVPDVEIVPTVEIPLWNAINRPRDRSVHHTTRLCRE